MAEFTVVRESLRSVANEDGLVVRDLSVQFGGVQALSSVAFQVPSGTTCAVVGPNGSGKTTLLNVISGLVRPTQGDVWVGANRLTHLRAASRPSVGVGRALQVPAIVAGWNVADYLLSAAYYNAVPGWLPTVARPRQSERKISAFLDAAVNHLESLGLNAALLQLPMSQVSLGKLKLVDVVRATLSGSRAVLLDEPTSGLALDEIALLAQYIAGLSSAGPIVVFVEHNLEFVAGIASNVVVLDQGKVAAEGPAEEVFRNPAVRTAYMGKYATRATQ